MAKVAVVEAVNKMTGKKVRKKASKKVVKKTARKPRKPTKPVETPLSALAKTLVGPDTRDGAKYFGAVDLQRYELSQYKVENILQTIQLKRREAEEVKRKAEQHLNTIGKQLVQLQLQQKEKEEALKSLQTAIGERYNIDVSVMSYDDETGRIYVGDSVVATPSTTK